MKKHFLIIFLIIILSISSCAASDNNSNLIPDDNEMNNSNNHPDSSVGEETYDKESNSNKDSQNISKLSSSAYNDNDHYSYWIDLINNGLFKTFNLYENLHFNTSNRIKITLPSMLDAKVNLLDNNGNVLYTALPTKDGVCYLYPEIKKASYDIRIDYMINEQLYSSKHTIINDTVFNIDGDLINNDIIDLMFVVDTTGSMMDELNFLKEEINNIINKVSLSNPNVIINVGILLYRDLNSSYVTLYSDFTTDISIQEDFLANKIAAEGGDYHEAVDIALSEVVEKNWSKETCTKLVIHIADAPCHDKDLNKWYDASLKLAAKGIRIISVASSGINVKTEYLFRSQSIITNGTYVYLTNHSGLGNEHLNPTVEGIQIVEYLSDCLVRLINGYHSGVFEVPEDILK